MNAVYIRGLGDNDLATRIQQVLLGAGLDADFLTVLQFAPLVKERMRTLSDCIDMLGFAFSDSLDYEASLLIPKKSDEQGALAILMRTSEAVGQVEPFSHGAIEDTMRALSDSLGLKPRDMLGAVRVAITGRTVSPPLFESMEILGRERVQARIAGAIERGVGGGRYPIGDENLTWVAWLDRLTALVGKRKRVITLPTGIVRFGARFLALSHRRQGRESGLNLVKFIDVQTRNTFFDPTPSCETLGYGRGGLDEALAKMVKACLSREG